jgi:hypothetical protein
MLLKQGTGKSTVAGGKVEPKSQGVNPAAVADLGVHQVRTKSISMYEGRGIEAPKAASSTHKSGSQGRH